MGLGIASNFLTALTLELDSELLHWWGSLLLALNYGSWGPEKAPTGCFCSCFSFLISFPQQTS